MIRQWIKQYRSKRWIKQYNVPQYCIDIVNKLKENHTTYYYTEIDGEHIIDCYIIDGFLIKLDRIPEIITLSENDLNTLMLEIDKLLDELKTLMINWGGYIT